MKETIVKINKSKSWFLKKKKKNLVLLEDKENWQTFSQAHQEKKRQESNQQN